MGRSIPAFEGLRMTVASWIYLVEDKLFLLFCDEVREVVCRCWESSNSCIFERLGE